MPDPRIFTRPQSVLRGFFGLGPAQVESVDLVHPTLDVEHLLRSNEDVQVVSTVSAVIAPGTSGATQFNVPAEGPWLIHGVSISTSGPATSGSFRMDAHFVLNSWVPGLQTFFGVFPAEPVLTLKFTADRTCKGKWFDKPVILYAIGVNIDGVRGVLFNDAASVGNATLQLTVLARQLENV